MAASGSLRAYSVFACLLSFHLRLALAQRHLMPDGTSVQFIQYEGAKSWQLFPNLWIEATVNVTCPDKKAFDIYVAPSEDALWAKVDSKQSTWCGWHRFVGANPASCVTRISAFGDTYVGAARPKATGFFQGKECQFEESRVISARMIVLGLSGAALFLNGGLLSQSLAFRLGTGSIGFALLSVIILLFVLARMLPNKRSMAAAFAVGGGAVSSACRYFFGSYLPSLQQLVQHPVLLAYLALSALVGLALTYYFDNPENVKLMTILEVGLQLGGLCLVALSTNLPEASVALCCILVAVKLAPIASTLWHRGTIPKSMDDMVEVVQQSLPTLSSSTGRRSASPLEQAADQVQSPMLSQPQPHLAVHYSHTPATSKGELEGQAQQQQQLQQSEHRRTHTASQHVHDSARLVERQKFSFRRAAGGTDGSFQLAATTPLTGEDTSPRGQQQQQHRTNQRQPGSPRRSAHTPSHAASPSKRSSALEDKGMLLNEATMRAVKVGSSTYNRLLKEGYQVDHDRGSLTPPKADHGSARQVSTPSSHRKSRQKT